MGLYTVKGLSFFLTHPHLWKESIVAILLTLVVAFVSSVWLFFWKLHPQEQWLHDKGFYPLFAWIFALFFVIVELFIITFIYGIVLLEYTKDKIFAYVLTERGYGSALEGRNLSALRTVGNYFQVDVILRFVLFVVSLPLNLIPVIGNLLFAWIHSTLIAWDYHVFYFEIKNWGYKQQKDWILDHKVKYTSFGLQALLLHMVPFVGPFFVFSNAAGAALLAIKFEKKLAKGNSQYQPFQAAPEHGEHVPLVNKTTYGTDVV